MKEKSPVFEENYQYYLDRIGAIDLAARADVLGAHVEADGACHTVFRRRTTGFR